MKKKICHISTAHPTYDTRIYYKQCRSLVNDYDVYLLITADEDHISEGVNIVHLPSKNSRMYRFFKKRNLAFEKAKEIDADIYHFHDPELIPVGKKLKKMGKKVIYDVHEDVPNQILTKEWLKFDFVRTIVSKIFNSYEKSAAKEFDKVICVSQEIADKFKSNNTAIVRNFPVLRDIDSIDKIVISEDKPIVIYAGGLTKIRGIKEIIKAIEILNGKVTLWLLGNWESEEYKQECINLPGFKYVKYFGSVPQKEVYSYMKRSDIGIVNFWPVDNHLLALPNKPFEYMACGLPMIMSNFPYWKEVFKGCFWGIDPKDPNNIAKTIENLIDKPGVMKELGENGRRFVLNKYSWESEKENLFKAYKDLV